MSDFANSNRDNPIDSNAHLKNSSDQKVKISCATFDPG